MTPIQLQKYVVVDQLCDKGFSGSNEIWDLKARRAYSFIKFVKDTVKQALNGVLITLKHKRRHKFFTCMEN